MNALIDLLERYTPESSQGERFREQILQFVRSNPDTCLLRSNLVAHLTGSAWIIDQQTRSRALLVHHAKLNRWLQPGGHADGDPDLRGVALKETLEETGMSASPAFDDIFDLDVHLIPFHKETPPHLHLDLRFLLLADSTQPLAVSEESHAVRWFNFDEIPALGIDHSVARLLEKGRKLNQ